LGVTGGDRYNDGMALFIKDYSIIANLMYQNPKTPNKDELTFFTPLENIHWKNINAEIVNKALDISHIWYCQTDQDKPCGKCEKCLGVHSIGKLTKKI
jgi:7-cyano-7-deazaguanine synthase in queuosine biosynthesis